MLELRENLLNNSYGKFGKKVLLATLIIPPTVVGVNIFDKTVE
jgi:hypothetical protein